MKRSLWLLLIFSLFSFHSGMAQSANFNFSLSPAAVDGWTNIAGDPNLAILTGASPSGISITTISRDNWITYEGTGGAGAGNGLGVANGTFFPAAVMQNAWFQFGQTTTLYNASVPQIIVSGLNPNSVYTFRMTGSWTGEVPDVFNLNPTLFTIAGITTNSASVNENTNISDGAVFNNFAPDANGQVRVYVNTTANTNTATICGLQIIEGPTTTGSSGASWSTTGNSGISGDTYFLGTVDVNRMAFRTNNVERMTILNDGTIGIGTKNTYGYTLAVNGTGIFTKLTVKAAGNWADYVFEKGYTLPTLAEVQQYIRKFKHLPGIPSASAVEAKGIDVGDQQAALLKKVEELTLYLIEQNARLDAQQKEIDQLKALIQANAKHH